MNTLTARANRCPDCGRILFPTREGLWPYHYAGDRHAFDPWCTRSHTVVTVAIPLAPRQKRTPSPKPWEQSEPEAPTQQRWPRR
jgi:hypothetical protein